MAASPEPLQGAVRQAHQFLQDCCRAMALCAETREASSLVQGLEERLDEPVLNSFEPRVLTVLDSLDLVAVLKTRE